VEAAVSTILDPRRIEGEIARIRERESNPYVSGIKTNLFNLVIYRGPRGGTEDPAAAALQSLLGKRPARIITLEAGGGEETGVTVAGRCFPDKRNRGVCFEEIGIQGSEDSPAMDCGSWSPLLIRDLPVFMWWLGSLSPLPGMLLSAADLIDKLIIDSSASGGQPLVTFSRLALIREKTRGVMGVSDLAWRRTFPLRMNVARLFNPPESRGRLSVVNAVELRGGEDPEALLFFLWLASRLGWTTGPGRGGLPSFRGPGGSPVRAVHSAAAHIAQGFRAAFSFGDGGAGLEVSCGADGCSSGQSAKSAWRPLDDGEALLQEVDDLKQDPLFLDAISAAAAAEGGGA
jgi:hypothetical protein